MGLDKLDLAIIALYLVGITLFGLRFRKRHRSLRDYFLAGRDIPWWAIALSIVAAETSTLTIISIPGLAYDTNLTFLQVVMGYLVGRVVISLVLLPQYFRGDLYTAYELIERRFGRGLRSLTAGLFLLTRAAAEGVRVYAVSIVVSIALGTGEVASIAIITALTLIYTFEGGLAAVIWTDVVQTAIYVGGTLIGLVDDSASCSGGMDSNSCRGGKRRQTAGVRFPAQLLVALHILGRRDRRNLLHHGEPRHRSTHRPAPAGGARAEAVDGSAAFERGGNSLSVCSFFDCGRNAVGVLSRTFRKLWKAGSNLPHVHCQPDAARNLWPADCSDSGGCHVESERGVEFAFVKHDHGFSSALAPKDR